MEAAQREAEPGKRLERVIWFLLVVMALDIARAAVQQNVSFVDLQRYIHLQEVSPYQERILMAWVLRAVQDRPVLVHLHHLLFSHTVDSPATLAIILTNSLCLLAMLPITAALRRSFGPRPQTSWLAPLVLLWVVAFTYVVRYEQRFSLPYDFPSMFLYNLGLLAVVRRRPWLVLAVLAVAIPNRETAVFLLAPLLLLLWRDGRRAAGLLFGAAGAAIFLLWRAEIAHVLHAPAQVYDFPYPTNRLVVSPAHWPQLLSAFGFLAVPLWLLRSEVRDRRLRDVWLASLLFLFAAVAVGVWWETRIFGELSAMVAVTLAVEIEARVGASRPRPLPA